MAHTPKRDRAGPRQDAPARTARMALMQPAIGAHDPRWAEHCRITGCQVVRRMMLFGDPATGTPGSLCCVGRAGPSPTPEVLVAR